jgi:hypothetical protein
MEGRDHLFSKCSLSKRIYYNMGRGAGVGSSRFQRKKLKSNLV